MKKLKFKLKKWHYIGIGSVIVVILLGSVIASTQINDQDKIDNPDPTPTVVPSPWKTLPPTTAPPTTTPPSTTPPEDISVYDVFICGEVQVHPLSPERFMSIQEIPIGVYYLLTGEIKYEKSGILSSLKIFPHRILPESKMEYVHVTVSPIMPSPTMPVPTYFTPPATVIEYPYEFEVVLVVDGVELRKTVTDSHKFNFQIAKLREGKHIISLFAYYIAPGDRRVYVTQTVNPVELTGESGEYKLPIRMRTEE